MIVLMPLSIQGAGAADLGFVEAAGAVQAREDFSTTAAAAAGCMQVGVVWAEPSRRGPDDAKQLHQLSFQTGDFLDVAIL
jgi:hypothetical protein